MSSLSFKVHGPQSARHRSAEHGTNPNFFKIRNNTLTSIEEPRRKKRKVKSRVVNHSRTVSISFLNEQLSTPNHTLNSSPRKSIRIQKKIDEGVSESERTTHNNLSVPRRDAQWSTLSAPILREDNRQERKQSVEDCDFFTLDPILPYMHSCPNLTVEYAGVGARNSYSDERGSYSRNDSEELHNQTTMSTNTTWNQQRFDSLDPFNEVSTVDEFSENLLALECTEEDYDTLPPYYQMIPQMFYRFAGISEYSNSNQLQSREDFVKLIKCLGMEPFLEDFLAWFPRPKLIKTGNGYISFDMFCDLFSCKFAQSILEGRWQYETLCSAILTMKCLEKNNCNRIEFEEFLRLYRSLNNSHVKATYVRNIFNKYDSDGIGFLTVVDIFNFCTDEEMGLAMD